MDKNLKYFIDKMIDKNNNPTWIKRTQPMESRDVIMNKKKYISQLAKCIDKTLNLSITNGKNSNLLIETFEKIQFELRQHAGDLILNTSIINRIALEVTGELIRLVNDIKNKED